MRYYKTIILGFCIKGNGAAGSESINLTKRKCKYIIPIDIVGISAKTRILRMRCSGFFVIGQEGIGFA